MNKVPDVPQSATLARVSVGPLLEQINEPAERKQQLVALLHSDAAATNQAALTVSAIALKMLPVGTLSPLDKAVYGRLRPLVVSSLCEHTVDAIHLSQPFGVKLGVDPQRLAALPARHSAYCSYRLLGAQVINLAMDRRAALAPMASILIDQLLDQLLTRFQDPALSRDERDALLNDFGPALMELDRVLSTPIQRKAEIKGQVKSLQQQLAEAQEDAAYAETQLKLRQRLLVPREELLAAARRHQAKHTPAAAPGADGRLPPPPGQRRIT